ncbi:hypothetical protein MUN82_20365 [Hymenobacter aerilatus]|uniref:Outer membrane protein beta-barrel domain-containing protein n=1 Tax=Hymenobacter aerilatus TaxID=2932251 RepID=A0A8T9SWC9_9BACT|nr:hypothetical protein [Hymenobacter aerilatus]UOR05274.1 hypothetical protein MUN82_20365 [Hymenobacter aerilatus]
MALSTGDTLRGEIENLFWSDPPTAIRFRAATTAPLTSYTARQLRGIGLASGRVLRREVVPLDRTAQVAMDKLPYGPSRQQRPDTVLADVLVDGAALLLEVKLNDVRHFLVRREGQPYLELAERRYLRQDDDATRVMDGNTYRGELSQYFNDCPPTKEVVKKAPFNAESIVRVVQSYNIQCSAERKAGKTGQTSEKGRSNILVQIGPVVGIRYNTSRLHPYNQTGQPGPLNDLDLDGQLHGQVGIYFDVVNPGRRPALHTALTYTRFGRRIDIRSLTGVGPDGSLDWRGQLISAQLGLRLLGKGRYQWLGGAGVELNTIYSESVFYSGFRRSLFPYLEAGVRHNRLTLALIGRRYGREELTNFSILEVRPGEYESSYHNYQSRTLSIALSLAYQLTRRDKIETR